MWKTTVVLFASLCQLVSWLNACPTIKNEDAVLLKSCDTTLMEHHLQVQCHFHASSSMGFPVVGVITTFKTARPFVIHQSNAKIDCLQLDYGRLRIVNPSELPRYLEKSTNLNVPPLLMTAFTVIKDIDFNVRFQSDEIVGMVSYSASCIRDKRRSSSTPLAIGHLNISECVNEVRVLKSVAAPASSLSDFHGFNLQNLDVISVFVGFIDQLLLNKYRGTVPNVTLTLIQGQYTTPLVVKEALAKLNERQVEALHLPNNHFETIGNDDLPALTTLKTLDFRDCRLRSIEPLAFQSLTGLIHLNLAGNQFTEIPQALVPLINLEILNLSSNKIVKTDLSGDNSYSSLFIGLPALQSLDLSNNDIDKLSPLNVDNEIDDHPRLLNLSGNKMQAWDEPMLNAARPIQLELDMTRNIISKVTAVMLTDFSKLNRIDLCGNPFDCDGYHLNIFQEWLSRNGTSNDLGTHPYKCASPKQCAGLDVIKVGLSPEVASCSSATSVTLNSFSRLHTITIGLLLLILILYI